MSADNRTVRTDALATLGTIIDDRAARGAIHIAVQPSIAGERLYPGDEVCYVNGKSTHEGKMVGIVDPFLKDTVRVGQRFWLLVFPRKITSLRHVWEHPDFPEEEPKKGLRKRRTKKEVEMAPAVYVTRAPRTPADESREWIENFAATYARQYEEVMETAASVVRCHNTAHNHDYITGGSELEGEFVPDEFWDHYERVMGLATGTCPRENFFRCAC